MDPRSRCGRVQARVWLREGEDEGVTETEPVEVDPQPDSRLQRDAELVEVLSQEGFRGPLWEYYAEELARYGCAVLKAWLRTGLIAKRCREHGRPVGVLPADWSPDDRWEIVLETVAKALEVFRMSLLQGKWSATAGASLRTYFIGGCVRAFPNVLRAWSREQDRWHRADEALRVDADSADRLDQSTPLEAVDMRDVLESMLADSPERTRAMMRLSFDGYTVSEIADVLGLEAHVVSAALHRSRAKARDGVSLDLGRGR